MPDTSFLPPFTAIRMVWALTGSFSNDEHSKHAALLAESRLKDIQQLAEKHGGLDKSLRPCLVELFRIGIAHAVAGNNVGLYDNGGKNSSI